MHKFAPLPMLWVKMSATSCVLTLPEPNAVLSPWAVSNSIVSLSIIVTLEVHVQLAVVGLSARPCWFGHIPMQDMQHCTCVPLIVKQNETAGKGTLAVCLVCCVPCLNTHPQLSAFAVFALLSLCLAPIMHTNRRCLSAFELND